MITINREKGYIVISRCEYLYRDGLENRDEKANREMGDGDIIIPLPPHMVDKSYDHTGRTDGMNAVTIIEEIARRLSMTSEKLNENIKSAREWGDVLVSKGRQSEADPYYWMAAGLEEFRNELSGQNACLSHGDESAR